MTTPSFRSTAIAALALLLGSRAGAQPPAGAEIPPLLRVEAGGPTAAVTALAFSPDGRTLYAAGFDKVVRAWEWHPDQRQFVPAPRAYRVPLGPGTIGTLNALAVSPDGEWLAASGLGLWQGAAGYREAGKVFPLPALTPAMRKERATIYLFQTRPPYAVKVLRGHEGTVVQLRFAPPQAGKPPLLVSAALEPGEKAGSYRGRLALWDITRAAYRDAQGKLVDPDALLDQETISDSPTKDVGLAVRHTGKAVKELHVAVAWGDGRLRIWAPDRARGERRASDVEDGVSGGLNSTVAYRADQRTLVTSGGQSEGGAFPMGRLQAWKDTSERGPEAASAPLLLRHDDDLQFLLPRALCLLPAAEQGDREYAVAAVQVRKRGADDAEFWLLPIDLDRAKPLTPISLWTAGDHLPVLAASPDGRFLAVAGNSRHEVWLYRVADLLQGKDRSEKRLRGNGTIWRSLAFLERPGRAGAGPHRALFLSTAASDAWGRPAAMRANDWVFDFAGRRLAADPAGGGWQLAGPAEQGWQVRKVDVRPPNAPGGRTRGVITWRSPTDAGTTTVLLGPRERVSDALLLPPTNGPGALLLAVAVWDPRASEPALRIYQTRTGEQVRQYVGHAQRISALAATADGKLLASAADDETVCVWNLADLDRILDRQGALPGLLVEQQGNGLIVTRVDPDCPVRDRVEVGTAIDGLILRAGAKPTTFEKAFDFYDTLWDLKPGTRVELAIRQVGKADTVPFTVGQGVDEQHPLFSLFVPEGPGPRREWIGWSPLGPFDASGPAAETQVGWHFNPRTLEEPATFAPLSSRKYRQSFYRPGLLGRLIACNRAVTRAPLARPRLSVEDVRTEGSVPPELLGPDRFLVRDRHVRFRLRVGGVSLDNDEVDVVSWQLDRGPDRGRVHRIDLDAADDAGLAQRVVLPDERGTYSVQVEVRTREDTPQVVTASLALHYQPPPPQIELAGAGPRQDRATARYRVVKDADFAIEARIQPMAGVKVSLEHQGKTTPLTPGPDGRVRQMLKLVAGENPVVLRAWNADAPEVDRSLETDTQALLLVYRPQPAPELRLTAVGLGDEGQEFRPVPAGQPVEVSTPTVHVRGLVEAGDEVPTVELLDATGKPVLDATGQPPRPRLVRGRGSYTLDQPLRLQPGTQVYQFRVSAAKQVATARLTLAYRPAFPEFDVLTPANDTSLVEDRDPPTIRPAIRFTAGTDVPFDVVIQVTNGGKPVAQAAGKEEQTVPLDRVEKGSTLPLPRVRLAPGHNRLRLLVSRRQKADAAGRASFREGTPVERDVFFRRPPQIVQAQATQPETQPFTTVTATVVSPSEPGAVRVRVDGRDEYTPAKVAIRQLAEAPVPTWEIRVPAVPLPASEKPDAKHTLALHVGNADGMCLAPFQVQVAGVRPRVPPPEVRIRTAAGPIAGPSATVSFRVVSPVPLTAVELRQGGRPPRALPALAMKPAPQGGLELRGAFDVALREGTNLFTIAARNAGGEREDHVELSRPRQAIRLVVEPPPAASAGPEVELRGHVTFRDEGEAARNENNLRGLRLFVNEFLQGPVVIERPPDPHSSTRSWHGKAVLNRSENRIEIDCPALPLDAGRRHTFTVRCDQPIPPATLHLLVVGVGAQNQKQLVAQAFKALQTQVDPVQGLRSPIFRRVVMHPYLPNHRVRVLSDNVSEGQVRYALESIRQAVHKQGTPNDVVLIYWLGRDAVRDPVNGSWYLPTSDSSPRRPPRETDVAVNDLLGSDDALPGARVLLLDAPSARTDAGLPVAGSDIHAGVIHYAWARAQQPLRGLLLAVERAATGRRPVSLQDVVRAAEALEEQTPGSLRVSHNLKALAPLGDLVITESESQTESP